MEFQFGSNLVYMLVVISHAVAIFFNMNIVEYLRPPPFMKTFQTFYRVSYSGGFLFRRFLIQAFTALHLKNERLFQFLILERGVGAVNVT